MQTAQTPNYTPRDTTSLRGRAATSNESGRFERQRRSIFDDGWNTQAARPAAKQTSVHIERPKAIITRNQSPDVPFERSINAYRGCEHGCIYCFARPSHAYMGLSAGQDFETEIFAKPNAADLLEREITRPGYEPKVIAMGTNTDPYQPVEKTQRITRALLEVMLKHRHRVSITTKSHLITRDIDLLEELARLDLVTVHMSVTTLNHQLARTLEPRAATPARRLDAMRELANAGVRVGVMVAPVIPALTDHEIEWILAAAKNAGASEAGWVMLRLPSDVAPLFQQWLNVNAPDRKDRVLRAVKDVRDGGLNDPRFNSRMHGTGPWADIIKQRFIKAARRNGLLPKSADAAPAVPTLSLFKASAAPALRKRATKRPIHAATKPATPAPSEQLQLL